MNKEFIKKMIIAEKYRYEALKEILPDPLKNKLQDFEKNAFTLLKDVVLEVIQEDQKETSKKQPVKKVDIDFSK